MLWLDKGVEIKRSSAKNINKNAIENKKGGILIEILSKIKFMKPKQMQVIYRIDIAKCTSIWWKEFCQCVICFFFLVHFIFIWKKQTLPDFRKRFVPQTLTLLGIWPTPTPSVTPFCLYTTSNVRSYVVSW
jgi:hypothetical protein